MCWFGCNNRWNNGCNGWNNGCSGSCGRCNNNGCGSRNSFREGFRQGYWQGYNDALWNRSNCGGCDHDGGCGGCSSDRDGGCGGGCGGSCNQYSSHASSGMTKYYPVQICLDRYEKKEICTLERKTAAGKTPVAIF